MRKEKIIADELQCMFLEGNLHGFKEEYINYITRRLRKGNLRIKELMGLNAKLREKVLEALVRTGSNIQQTISQNKIE